MNFSAHRALPPSKIAAGLTCIVAGLTLLICDVEAKDIHLGAELLNVSVPENLEVLFINNRISVRAHDITILDLLEEISQKTGLIMVLRGPLHERISVQFEGLTVSKALSNILRDYSFALHYTRPAYGSNDHLLPSSNRLWVFSKVTEENYLASAVDSAIETLESKQYNKSVKNTVEGLRELATEAAISTHSLALLDDNINNRLKAIYNLTEIGGEPAAKALEIVLIDSNDIVREEAVNALGEIGGKIAVSLLEQALADLAVNVRESAIEALADIGSSESRQAITIALNTKNDSMRSALEEALADIDSGLNSPSGYQNIRKQIESVSSREK